MALTRKLLSALGIEADKIEQIIEAHTETVDALKKERDGYKEKAEAFEDVQKELDDLKKSRGEDDSYKAKYEKEHKDFEDYKKDVADKEVKATKQKLYKELLEKVGVTQKSIKLIMNSTDWESLELDKDNAVKSAADVEKSIKEKYADYIEEKQQRGANVETPPANNGGNGGQSFARARAAKLHAQLYGEQPKGE